MKLMDRYPKFVEVFSKFGEVELTENYYEIVEEFVCAMYGRAKQNAINAVIRLQFKERSNPSESKRPLDCIKSLEPSIFPPCKRTLRQHIRRTWYIARRYKTATTEYPADEYTPIYFGWALSSDNEHLDVHWYDDEQIPAEI